MLAVDAPDLGASLVNASPGGHGARNRRDRRPPFGAADDTTALASGAIAHAQAARERPATFTKEQLNQKTSPAACRPLCPQPRPGHAGVGRHRLSIRALRRARRREEVLAEARPALHPPRGHPLRRLLHDARAQGPLRVQARPPRRSGPHAGLFQFRISGTWGTTPYARRSPWRAKWNALAAAWMHQAGRGNEWTCR